MALSDDAIVVAEMEHSRARRDQKHTRWRRHRHRSVDLLCIRLIYICCSNILNFNNRHIIQRDSIETFLSPD